MLLQLLVNLKKWRKMFHKIPGVFQKYRKTICFSRTFSGSWKIISKFQEFSRNSRSFPGIPGVMLVVSTIIILTNIWSSLPFSHPLSWSPKLWRCSGSEVFKSFLISLFIQIAVLGTKKNKKQTNRHSVDNMHTVHVN